jgi:hypothetical protein
MSAAGSVLETSRRDVGDMPLKELVSPGAALPAVIVVVVSLSMMNVP